MRIFLQMTSGSEATRRIAKHRGQHESVVILTDYAAGTKGRLLSPAAVQSQVGEFLTGLGTMVRREGTRVRA